MQFFFLHSLRRVLRSTTLTSRSLPSLSFESPGLFSIHSKPSIAENGCSTVYPSMENSICGFGLLHAGNPCVHDHYRWVAFPLGAPYSVSFSKTKRNPLIGFFFVSLMSFWIHLIAFGKDSCSLDLKHDVFLV